MDAPGFHNQFSLRREDNFNPNQFQTFLLLYAHKRPYKQHAILRIISTVWEPYKIVKRASSESSYATRTYNERFEFFPRSKPSTKFLVHRNLIYFTILEKRSKDLMEGALVFETSYRNLTGCCVTTTLDAQIDIEIQDFHLYDRQKDSSCSNLPSVFLRRLSSNHFIPVFLIRHF